MRFKAIATTAALVAPSFLFGSAPAQATFDDCSSHYLCLWGNDNYHWMISYRYQGYSNFANLTGDRNDEMDSWANKSPNYSGCMTGDANGGGDRQVARYNTWDNDVAPWNSDEVSSYRTAFGCG